MNVRLTLGRRWFVTSTIIGATSMEQLEENINAFNCDICDECLEARGTPSLTRLSVCSVRMMRRLTEVYARGLFVTI